VVLVVVIFERLLRHEGLERLVVVRQFGKFKGHGKSPFMTSSGAGDIS
jgi:hypothetical protein